MQQLSYQWTDFHGISYLNAFPKSVKKIQLSLKYDKDGRYVI